MVPQRAPQIALPAGMNFKPLKGADIPPTLDQFEATIADLHPTFQFSDLLAEDKTAAKYNARLGDTLAVFKLMKKKSWEGWHLLVCYEGTQPVGLVSAQPRHELWSDERYLAIDLMVTHPKMKGKGIGKRLSDQALQLSEELGSGRELRLNPFNDNSRDAFGRIGFGELGSELVYPKRHLGSEEAKPDPEVQ